MFVCEFGLTALVFVRSVAALAALHPDLPLRRASSLVPRLIVAGLALALGAEARELLVPSARELVWVQNVQNGEGCGSVDGGALEREINYRIIITDTLTQT